MKPTPEFDVIRDAVALACRAPSLHNSQPWRWIADGAALHLLADPTRMMIAADPQGREITLSCGAALDHLTVAMRAAGWKTAVVRFPDPYEPFHLATVNFRPAADHDRQAISLRADAIARRRTDRRPFDPPDDWPRLEVLLRQAMIPYQVMCDVVLDDFRPRLAEASRLTGQIRAGDPSYEAELRWWSTPFIAYEGVPQSALLSATEAVHVDVARDFPTEKLQRPADNRADQSKIVVLSTHHEDARLDVLRCGEALSALLLECTVAGLATCTLTHMTELAPSREIIRELTGQHGLPQLLVRVGKAPGKDRSAPDPTPRRPLDEVLEFRQ